MDYFPIFCQLNNKPCLLVGGGEVAERKARLLMDAGAVISVVAPTFTPQFMQWQNEQRLQCFTAEFSVADLADKWLVIAATDNEQVNQLVYQQATEQRIFCNVVDSPKQASFIMPSVIDRSPIMVAISSGGKAPVLARILREKMEQWLPNSLGALAQLAGKLREQVKQRFVTMSARRYFWERFFADKALQAEIDAGRDNGIQQRISTLLAENNQPQGSVVLVGAGPGDAGLMTIKGLQQCQQADVVVYDRLVSDEVMHLVRRDAERIYVGKRAGFHCVPQEEINQILINHAKAGKRVVRLKGGDPFIFGRGSEELEALIEHQILFSVVPGITAASGCTTYAGIPLTHRDYAQSVRFITGHGKGLNDAQWQCIAQDNQTLVFYMGLSKADYIQQMLLNQHMRATMPVAIVEKGTLATQKVVVGQLQQLAEMANSMQSPALIIVGEVVSLNQKLQWFGTTLAN
ncbi:TPA: uroporphyrinogen-III C-methyltransferase [Proteus mirabilis]|uniref:siroheme synthase CysG n=1 Tax=Proteus mirabilis TaxID=584 RepID=UPI0018C710A8|nr:siroheme synthase CysG [Proteus mirabilis]MBG3109088.1 uroporphyrinogen-III C-methyltransferase [Proteus mirabilis]MDM3645509.1 siroheme synthase CysG [Proteus mirabilis]HAU5557326.1 uroporphyrinogen-III C-methyltransferase [Proteus mirabilis]HEI9879265.1 uroporphyrinogen-III C-methyltransferase [Proteus mirabilis]HEJ9424474.1 uroporphyrinogen-III C-methyltransferase [Proteus mirabilis]